MHARLGPAPTKEAEEEFLKYQQIQQKLNKKHNATGSMERRATEKRRDPMLENAEVTYAQMCSMHQERGEDLRINQLRDHWDNLQAITEDNQSETTAGYTKMSFPTMCAMLQYRGQRFSEDQLKEQWRYLKQVEDDETHEKPMLCAQGCGRPVTRRKKTLSPEAQYELLKNSCCTPCWMHALFPEEYARLGWDQREAHHGGGCLQDLLKNQPLPKKDVDALEASEWQHLET